MEKLSNLLYIEKLNQLKQDKVFLAEKSKCGKYKILKLVKQNPEL